MFLLTIVILVAWTHWIHQCTIQKYDFLLNLQGESLRWSGGDGGGLQSSHVPFASPAKWHHDRSYHYSGGNQQQFGRHRWGPTEQKQTMNWHKQFTKNFSTSEIHTSVPLPIKWKTIIDLDRRTQHLQNCVVKITHYHTLSNHKLMAQHTSNDA